LHLFGCLYYCINDARSHKHQIHLFFSGFSTQISYTISPPHDTCTANLIILPLLTNNSITKPSLFNCIQIPLWGINIIFSTQWRINLSKLKQRTCNMMQENTCSYKCVNPCVSVGRREVNTAQSALHSLSNNSYFTSVLQMFKERKEHDRFSLTTDMQGQNYKDGLAMTVYVMCISLSKQGKCLL